MKTALKSPALRVIYGIYGAILLYTAVSFFFEALQPPVWWGWYIFSFAMAEVGKATFVLMVLSAVVLAASVVALFLPRNWCTVLLNLYLILFCVLDILACVISALDYLPGAADYCAPTVLDAVLIVLIITAMVIKRRLKKKA